jgi:hypothetical protein
VAVRADVFSLRDSYGRDSWRLLGEVFDAAQVTRLI